MRGWAAVRGYDLSSGLGTIRAAVFVRSLVRFSQQHRQRAPRQRSAMITVYFSNICTNESVIMEAWGAGGAR